MFNSIKKLPNCFPQRLLQFAFPPAKYECSSCSPPHEHLVWSVVDVCVCFICLYVCLSMCVMVSHCGLNLHFLVNDGVELFSRAYFPSVYLWRCVFSSFFKWGCFLIVEFWEFVTHFRYSPLTDRWLANIFSPSVACLSILWTVSLTELHTSPIHRLFPPATVSAVPSKCLHSRYPTNVCWMDEVMKEWKSWAFWSLRRWLRIAPLRTTGSLLWFLVFKWPSELYFGFLGLLSPRKASPE